MKNYKHLTFSININVELQFLPKSGIKFDIDWAFILLLYSNICMPYESEFFASIRSWRDRLWGKVGTPVRTRAETDYFPFFNYLSDRTVKNLSK